MQIQTTFTFLTMAAIAAAAQSFSLLVIRSGSGVQYDSIATKDGTLTVSAGNDGGKYILTDELALYDPNTKKYVTVQGNIFVESDSADNSFSNDDGSLTYKKGGFYYDLSYKLTSTGTDGIVLRILDAKDVANPQPQGSSDNDKKDESKVQFGVITIRSGSKFQNGPIKKVDSHPHVFSVGGNEGTDVTFTLSPDGTMVDQDGRGVNYDSNTGELGSVDPFNGKPSQGFSIKDGALFHDDKENWKACPSGDDKYSLADNDCTGGTPIELKVVGQKNV